MPHATRTIPTQTSSNDGSVTTIMWAISIMTVYLIIVFYWLTSFDEFLLFSFNVIKCVVGKLCNFPAVGAFKGALEFIRFCSSLAISVLEKKVELRSEVRAILDVFTH